MLCMLLSLGNQQQPIKGNKPKQLIESRHLVVNPINALRVFEVDAFSS